MNFLISKLFKKIKRHNFFLNFLKRFLILIVYSSVSKIKGIKIQIKGRFNNYSRARTNIIKISNLPPVLTKSANISFNERLSHTRSGTFGIKV